METFFALLALCVGNSPVTDEFPSQRPVTRSFDVFFDLRLNKPLSKQSWGWWFETPSRPLWHHCNDPRNRNWERAVKFRFIVSCLYCVIMADCFRICALSCFHYNDAIMDAIASQITSLEIVYTTVYAGADQRKQSSASLAFVRGIHRWPVNSPHKGPVTRKKFPFDYVIMVFESASLSGSLPCFIQGSFTATTAIVRLYSCQWSNPKRYG